MTKPPTKAKKKKAAPPKRPSDLHRALSLLHGERPLHVPETATLLVAWVDLPGDNTQRTQHWAVKRRWQEAVKDHFAQCLALQPHPGVLESPMVHVQMRVAAPGDERNRTGRAKYLLDKLQVRREVDYTRDGKRGVRVHGLLDLISDDKHLNAENCTLEEIRTPVKAGEPNARKVLVWVWKGAA